MKNLLFFLTFLLFTPLLSWSQGTISGTILDEKIGEPLIGANVVIENTATGTATDFDGKYQFSVEPGIYNMVFSYIGYNDKTVTEVEIKDGEVTYLDVTLSDEAVDLALDVVVTARSVNRSENAILMLQRKSDKIQDGISSQEMSRFSVGDAAAAMKKVTGATVSGGKYIYIRGLGDRYSLSQLNSLVIPSADPYRNGAQLDLIPSSLIENIITAKTFTPDQPGTFTGGNVNIQTKSFPEQFSLTISVSSAFNSQNNFIDNFLTHEGGANDYWGFDDGTRSQPDFSNDLKAQALLGFDTNIPRIARNTAFYNAFVGDESPFDGIQDFAQTADRVTKSFSSNFTPETTSVPVDHGFSIAFGNQYKVGSRPLGVIFSASYSHTYQHLDGFEKANFILRANEIVNQGDFAETLSTETPTVNGLLGLAYKYNDFGSITFNAIYNHSADKISRFIFGERPDNITDPEFLEGRSLVFKERDLLNLQLGGEQVISNWNNVKIEWKGSYAESSLLEPDTRFFENQFNAEFNDFLIPASNVQRPFHFFRDLEDVQYDAKLDITIPLGINTGNKVKFGGLYTKKERDFFENRYQVEEHVGFTTLYAGDPDVYLAPDNYGLIGENNNGGFTIANYIVDRTEDKNTYFGTDEVTAFYGMLTYNLTDRFKFIGGARYEKTNLFVISADENQEDGRIDDTDILPSVNLVYALNDKMNLRAAFTQTLARPNMREIAPFEAFDPLTKEIYFGNTALDKTKIQNYDLRWEWFTQPGELIALSSYYKRFDKPIVQSYRRAPNPEIEFVNVDQAELFGVEIELRKDLESFIPALKDLKFSTNLSLISSSADVRVQDGLEDLEPDDRPFEGQAPFILNAALIYSNLDKGIDATLSLNAIGDRLRIIGREGTPDIFDRGRNQLDFSFIKKFGNLNIKVTARNLLNATYLQSSVFDRTGEENVYLRFKRGITYGLGVSYTIK